MSIEAMKQALEALEEVQGHMNTSDWFNERVDTLRTTIEQAEKQEPVAWGVHDQIALNKAIASYPAPAEAEKQEPVAWINAVMEQAQVFASAWSLVGGLFDGGSAMDDAEVAKNELRQMLATPPKREFVGLTDEEYRELHLQMGAVYFYQDYGRAIEAKLKEKNT